MLFTNRPMHALSMHTNVGDPIAAAANPVKTCHVAAWTLARAARRARSRESDALSIAAMAMAMVNVVWVLMLASLLAQLIRCSAYDEQVRALLRWI